jgi:Beta-propeller repeat
VAVDAAGNSYVAGATSGALGFKIGSFDGYVRKYSSAGAVIWTRQFGTTGSDVATDVAVDGSGNVFVLGQDNRNGFIVRKFSSAGVLLASRTVTNASLPFLEPTALAIDSIGNVIVLTQWFGGATSGYNVRVFKLTTALADVWNVPYQTNFSDYAFDVATLGTDIYITARIDTPTAGFGARYAKLNSAGTIILTRQLEPTPSCSCTFPRSIAVDGSGFVYVTGYTSGAFTGFTNAGSFDIVAFKYDAAGTRIWVRQLGAGTYGSTDLDFAQGVAVSDSVYVTGYTFGNLLGDPKYGVNDADAFLAQLDKTTGAVLGIDQ